ncbi:MAG: hypothetical protein IH934_00440 [Nanoarchaeota archaeon]|nr:hypothetical protein [Nanoarchaeota archaeon]
MYTNRPYSIDDIVRYNPNNQYNNNLNYLVSKSENYSNPLENSQQVELEYKGNHQKPTIYSENNYLPQEPTKTYYFTPEIFLKPFRPLTQFINTTEQIQTLIEETFELMLSKKLPNINIQVCNKEELKQIHSRFGSWNDNIQGFALNNKHLKQIFVKNNNLDELMLTIGHEIGHVYTKSLSNNHDEEAKAFSFAIEWTKTIKKHNIGNLNENIKDNLDFNPARNGLHDLAFFFVKNLVDKGLKPMQVHWDLVKGYVSLFGFYN